MFLMGTRSPFLLLVVVVLFPEERNRKHSSILDKTETEFAGDVAGGGVGNIKPNFP